MRVSEQAIYLSDIGPTCPAVALWWPGPPNTIELCTWNENYQPVPGKDIKECWVLPPCPRPPKSSQHYYRSTENFQEQENRLEFWKHALSAFSPRVLGEPSPSWALSVLPLCSGFLALAPLPFLPHFTCNLTSFPGVSCWTAPAFPTEKLFPSFSGSTRNLWAWPQLHPRSLQSLIPLIRNPRPRGTQRKLFLDGHGMKTPVH